VRSAEDCHVVRASTWCEARGVSRVSLPCRQASEGCQGEANSLWKLCQSVVVEGEVRDVVKPEHKGRQPAVERGSAIRD
jgi:hypothetical protein